MLKTQYKQQVLSLLGDLPQTQTVEQMHQYIQHGCVTTFDHCVNVALMSYALAETFHLPVNRRILVLGAFLHDFYLYDWHSRHHGRLHGFRHPRIARDNAAVLLNQPAEVTQIIVTHMWPLTLFHMPTSLEGWVVCFADKVVTLREVFEPIMHFPV